MAKKILFPTISIGSEPEKPDIEELASFIRSHRGSEGDLITFYLVRSLSAQKEAGISSPCGGGLFCMPRLEASILCTPDGFHHDSSAIAADAEIMFLTAGPGKSALPAPHQVPGSPDPDDDERYADYCDEFAGLLRDMRDAGITGHILHAQRVCPIEIERLASRKISFIIPDGGEEVQRELLEFQHTITLTNSRLSLLDNIIDQYDVRGVTIINPDIDGFRIAMQYFDTDQISAGGYGTGQESDYWKKSAENATITINLA